MLREIAANRFVTVRRSGRSCGRPALTVGLRLRSFIPSRRCRRSKRLRTLLTPPDIPQ